MEVVRRHVAAMKRKVTRPEPDTDAFVAATRAWMDYMRGPGRGTKTRKLGRVDILEISEEEGLRTESDLLECAAQRWQSKKDGSLLAFCFSESTWTPKTSLKGIMKTVIAFADCHKEVAAEKQR